MHLRMELRRDGVISKVLGTRKESEKVEYVSQIIGYNLVLLIAQWDLFANLVSHHPIVIVVYILSILEETRPTIMASKNCHVKRSVTVSGRWHGTASWANICMDMRERGRALASVAAAVAPPAASSSISNSLP